MSKEDLIPFTQRTEDEVKAMNAKGGRKSGETRRRKKLLRETIEEMLSRAAVDGKYKQQLMDLGIAKKKPNNQDAIVGSMMLRALEGSERAFELLRDTLGEKPAEKVELNTIEINITEDED